MQELEGLYNCLELFLKVFHEEECVKEHSKELYEIVKAGCGMAIEHRKTSIRGEHLSINLKEDHSFNVHFSILSFVFLLAALKILENHFNLLADDGLKEYKWWNDLLSKYLKSPNKEDQLAAFHAMNSFYRGAAKILKKTSEEHETLKVTN